MGLITRILLVAESDTHVEYRVLDGQDRSAPNILIDKRNFESQRWEDPRQGRAAVIAMLQFRRTGRWPAAGIRQS